MGNSEGKISKFVQAKGADAIPRMSRMLLVDRTITDINVRDSTLSGRTALHYQAYCGTTASLAWLLRQDPPPDIEVRDSDQWTPLMLAAWSKEDPEGKVRLLLDHGANRDAKDGGGYTVLNYSRYNRHFDAKKPKTYLQTIASADKMPTLSVILEEYRPDVSR